MENSSDRPQQPLPAAQQAQRSIDLLDQKLLDLLEQRSELVQQVYQLDGRGPVGRVAEAAAHIDAIVESVPDSPQQTSRSSKAAILRHISSVCLGRLHEMRAIYLGPKYSYSHLAAIKYFGDASVLTPVASIPAVFDAVERGDASTGIVPIENSTDGRVVDTLGMFVRREMQICGEVLLPIHHNLLSKSPRDQIVEVHSKPQALSQCRGWLARNLPHAKIVETGSSATAAQLASTQPGVAAVASLEAGREHNLDVVDANIEDNPNNVTRFAVLGKELPGPTSDDKTAILFQVNHQPGALADAMTVFKANALNLTWIESFPSPDAPNEYLFFIELTGHRDDQTVSTAVAQLAKASQRLTILGSYPRAHLL